MKVSRKSTNVHRRYHGDNLHKLLTPEPKQSHDALAATVPSQNPSRRAADTIETTSHWHTDKRCENITR